MRRETVNATGATQNHISDARSETEPKAAGISEPVGADIDRGRQRESVGCDGSTKRQSARGLATLSIWPLLSPSVAVTKTWFPSGEMTRLA